MVRLEFAHSLQDELSSWEIPGEVLRQFYLNLQDECRTLYFLEQTVLLDGDLYEHSTHLPASSSKAFHFTLRLDRADELHFRVVQCSAYATDGKRIVWSSP